MTTNGGVTYTDTYLYRQDGSPLELLRTQGGTTTPYWYVLDGQGTALPLLSPGRHLQDGACR